MLEDMAIRVTKTIRCAQTHLWSFFDDPRRLQLWVPGLEGLEVTSPPPHGVGTTYVMHVREGRTLQAYQGETLIWDPPRRVKEHLWGGRLKPGDRMTADYRLVPRGEHVRFEYENRFQFKGFWMAVLRPLYFLIGHAYCRSMIRTLKRVAEAELDASEPPSG
jgi:carbon monoxide dehydrogenase subunit G